MLHGLKCAAAGGRAGTRRLASLAWVEPARCRRRGNAAKPAGAGARCLMSFALVTDRQRC
jgi:hypothetical protein